MTFRSMALLLAPVALMACVTEPLPAPPVTDPMGPACGAEGLQGLIGQPQTVLAAMKFANPTRVIEPGMAVTMDYSPTRLNIWIGEDGRIERVTCG